MSLINVSHLSFGYDGSYEDVFEDVSFQIDTDWKLGFTGRNGRGKTTFLNLLLGKYKYSGTISASVEFEYFPFEVKNPEEITLHLLEEMAPDAQPWQVQKEISKLAVDEGALYRPFYTLSNGEQTKVMLAGLFLRENHFLLIDEPTNHLDREGRRTVANYLNGKSGFILVSHDRAFLDECTDHTLSINKNQIEIIASNFSGWWEQKRRQDEFELGKNERLKKDVKRLEASARQSAGWADKIESSKMGKGASAARKKGHVGMDTMAYNGKKSLHMQQRRKNLERRQQISIEEKQGLLKNIETAEALKLYPLDYRSPRLLTLDHVSISYDGREILHDFNLAIEQGDRIALEGGNGSGKSSLLKLICGKDIPHTGQVQIGSQLVISYVPQDTNFLQGSLNDYIEGQKLDETLVKAMLRKLDFSRTQFDKEMEEFSAGQKKKVLLASSLCRQAHLYIWDEPLNYIDILSRMQIEDLILQFHPTLLFVEHDRAFCENIATRSVEL